MYVIQRTCHFGSLVYHFSIYRELVFKLDYLVVLYFHYIIFLYVLYMLQSYGLSFVFKAFTYELKFTSLNATVGT